MNEKKALHLKLINYIQHDYYIIDGPFEHEHKILLKGTLL